MSWKTAEPPWTLGGKYNKTSYNEGNKITSNSNPVWDYPTQGATPITTTHNPCGYWNLGSGVCGDAVISYSTAIMEVGDTQTFSVTTTVIGSSYTWEIESGLGSLSTATGNTTVFTAAAVGYTTIIMKCQGAKCSSFRVRTIEYTYTVAECWELERESFNKSVSHGGLLYFGSNDGNVYSFDGTTDTLVGAPQAGAADPKISALVSHGGNLYASVYAGSGVYRYDGGTTWTSVGTPGLTRVCTLYSNGTYLYAGARQVGSAFNGVYVWNGTSTWTKLGTADKFGNSDNINAIISFNGDIIAGNYPVTAYKFTDGEFVSMGRSHPTEVGTIGFFLELNETLYTGRYNPYMRKYVSGTTWTAACYASQAFTNPIVCNDSIVYSTSANNVIYSCQGNEGAGSGTLIINLGYDPGQAVKTLCVHGGDLYSISRSGPNAAYLCRITYDY